MNVLLVKASQLVTETATVMNVLLVKASQLVTETATVMNVLLVKAVCFFLSTYCVTLVHFSSSLHCTVL